jgi:hypothetical protein
MDYGKSFTYPFEDKEWVTKILIGSLLSVVPFVNLVVLGYVLKVIRNVADGIEPALPNWDDFADFFMKGLVAALGTLVYALPIIATALAMAFFGALTGYDSGSSQQFSPFVFCIWGLSCLTAFYGLFMALVLPAAYVKYALRGDFGAFFRFGEIFHFITSNLGNYAIAMILTWIASFIAGFGVILCGIGIVFTEFWATLVMPHLLGQIVRLSGAPSEPAPPIAAAAPTV